MTTETGGLELEAVRAHAQRVRDGNNSGERSAWLCAGNVLTLAAEVEQLRREHADGCVQTAESLRTLIRAVLDVCDRLAANAATNPSQVVAVATMVIVREIRAALGVSA